MPVKNPVILTLLTDLSVFVSLACFILAVLNSATIRYCDGMYLEPLLTVVAGITFVYHAIVMLVDCSSSPIWFANPRQPSKGVKYTTSYSALWSLIIVALIWASWLAFLPNHITYYNPVTPKPVEGHHFHRPLLVLQDVEIGVRTTLEGWAIMNRRYTQKLFAP